MLTKNYQGCDPNQPMERVNGYNIRVDIQSKDNTPMSELEFECEFRIDWGGRKLVIGKEGMVEVVKDCRPTEYYAQLYSTELGNASGWLMCTIAIKQPDPTWPCGFRDVTLEDVFTGIYIGKPCGRLPRVPRNVCNGKHFINGFKVNFEKVDYLPKASYAYLYYGVLRGAFQHFEAVTTGMASNLETLTSKPSKPIVLDVRAGETVTVLVPEEMNLQVTKDDGFGGHVAFDEEFFGANGVPVTMGEYKYRAFGERVTVSGRMVIYIE